MKKIIIAAIAAILSITSCGVGTYPIVTGRSDECGLSFVSKNVMAIDVTIDGLLYEMNSIKYKRYAADKLIKPTNKNTVILRPGEHDIVVKFAGQVIYARHISVAATEHRVIELQLL